jgi:hypothetical protein
MMTQKEMDAELINSLIAKYRGNLTSVARELTCDRHTLYAFIASHATCQKALANSRESMIDNAESSLYAKVLEGEAWAVCFFLKTQGKKRGYVERQEVTGADAEPIKLIVTYENPPVSHD